jgi:hypothetical protein
MPRSGAVTLSDVIDPTLTLVCKPCGRRGVYSVARLQAKHGDAKLPDLRAFLSEASIDRRRQSMPGALRSAAGD